MKHTLLGPLALSNLCPVIDLTVDFILFAIEEAPPASEMLCLLNKKEIGNVQHMLVYVNLSLFFFSDISCTIPNFMWFVRDISRSR
jgi:hypothetical protein